MMMMLVLMKVAVRTAVVTLTSCSLGCPSDARTGRGGRTFQQLLCPLPMTSE
ncbi:hypothetical protein ABVT39_015658, partial [Epinephelus coioides]